MADETVVRRLHVSGLTPAITPEDLSQKLGSFGAVKALDGFGQLDALGQPRKFGYVTIETTKSKLARCMNLLSGVTWKGTKLRIGEAKPDFRERLAKERESSHDGEPLRKKRRLPRGVHGVHAVDMSLVTPENVAERGGWHVTPLGRIIKPMRMRPEHPLPDLTVSETQSKTKKEKDGKPRRKRTKTAPVRARRRTIDPLKWDSTQLKGVFLENSGANRTEARRHRLKPQSKTSETSSSEEESEGENSEQEIEVEKEVESTPTSEWEDDRDFEETIPPKPVSLDVVAADVSKPPPPTHGPTSPLLQAPLHPVASEILQEKSATLGLLQSLFGDRGDDWVGQESLSDIDMDEQHRPAYRPTSNAVEEDDIEVVPMDVDKIIEQGSSTSSALDPETDFEPEPEQVTLSFPAPQEETTEPPKPTQLTRLKDLFAPTEENAGFSLLGQLELDLELDDDILNPTLGLTVQPQVIESVPNPEPTHSSTTMQPHARLALDPSLPLFFPISEEARASMPGRVKDTLDVLKETGWDWRNFHRTESSEEIKQRWESQKVELTKDWKRRHREALKSRRRRGGADGE